MLCRGEPGKRPTGGPAQVGLEDRGRDLAEELHIAERRSAPPVIQIEVVDSKGLLVDRIVGPAGVDGQHGGAVVIYEIAADDAGPVGYALGAGSAGRAQQDRGRVHRPGGQDDGRGADLPRLAPVQEFDPLDAPSVGGNEQTLDLGTGDERDGWALQRLGQRCRLGVVLAAARVRVSVPGRWRASQPAVDVDRKG